MSMEKYNCIEASTGTQKCIDNEKFWCLTNDGSCHANRESDQKPVGLNAPVLMEKWGLANIDVGVDDEYKLFGPAKQVESTRDELRRLHSKGKVESQTPVNIKMSKYDLMVKAQKSQVDIKPIHSKQELINVVNTTRMVQKTLELEKERSNLKQEQLMLSLMQRDVRYISKSEKERIKNDFYATHVLIVQQQNEEARNLDIERHVLAHAVAKSLSNLASRKLNVINDSKNLVFFTVKRIAYNILLNESLSEVELTQRMVNYIDNNLSGIDYPKGWIEYMYIIEKKHNTDRLDQIQAQIIEYFKREKIKSKKITVTTEVIDRIHKEIEIASKGLLSVADKEIVFRELIKPEELRLSGISTNKRREELFEILVNNVVKKALNNPLIRPTESVIVTSTSLNKKTVVNYIPIKSESVNSEVKELFKNVMGM